MSSAAASTRQLNRRTAEDALLLAELDGRLRFETLLADLSAAFINLPPAEVDDKVEDSLRQIIEFLDLDRGGVAELSEDGSCLRVTHSYVVPGLPPSPGVIVNEAWPWYGGKVLRGELIRLARLPDDLPPEAVREREYCLGVGMKSQVTIPFRVGGEMIGALGLASFRKHRDWPDELVGRLRLVADVFANALARKRAEEESHRLRDQLAHVGRVATMGELAGSIAHEVNQPLCAIVSNAHTLQRMLARPDADPAEVRDALEDIRKDGKRASEVVGRIRALLKRGQVEHAPQDLNALVQEVLPLARSELGKNGITLHLELAADLPPVRGDRVQLQQVVLNLLVNAAEAMAGTAAGRRRLVVRTARDGPGGASVAVSDSGTGVAPQSLGRVFDAFFTTKPGGMGMGLAISRSIVADHGGTIAAANNADGGATFTFTLPGR
jgi:signal transduction histidine kinase